MSTQTPTPTPAPIAYNRTIARQLLDNMTCEQANTFLSFYIRQREESPQPKTWHAFFASARWDSINDCVMLPYAGAVVGIERDGYAHS
jgi:hypothetical protein